MHEMTVLIHWVTQERQYIPSQNTPLSAVHPYQKSPIGKRIAPGIIGNSLYSGLLGLPFAVIDFIIRSDAKPKPIIPIEQPIPSPIER